MSFSQSNFESTALSTAGVKLAPPPHLEAYGVDELVHRGVGVQVVDI